MWEINSLFSVQAPPTIVDWQDRLTLDQPWVNWELSAIMSTIKRLLLDVIINIAVVIYSGYLSRWRLRGLTLLSFMKGMHQSPICLNASMFAWIIHDQASSTEEVSMFFYESFQSAFPNNVLVSQFCSWSTAHHPTEERGGVSRAH